MPMSMLWISATSEPSKSGTACASWSVVFPPRSILVPVDFSDASRTALGFGARLARHCKADLHVVHAQPPLLDAAAAMRDIDLHAETRDALTAFMRDTPPAGDWLPIHHVDTGDPADVIGRAIVRHRVHLVVMGPRGLSGLARLVLGSTTRAVLRSSTASVLVVPPSWAPPNPGRDDLVGLGPVIVGVDDYEAPGRALDAGAALAAALHSPLQVVHVDTPAALTRARQALAAAMERVPDGARAAVHAVDGDNPAEALATFVASTPLAHKLVCIGTHDTAHHDNTEQALVSLMSRTAVPVLVVRPWQ
jgi:nucleotide-binding universal stress UspA family protein